MEFTINEDTICAISTPIGEGGIGVVKISGSEALTIARKIFQPSKPLHSFESHHLYYGWIVDPDSQTHLDEVLLSYMAAPRTYTREDVVEINCHSGYLVLNKILELVLSAGARLAQPGEFTKRAFLNGRIDLSQAEAVIEILHARSEQSLLLANRHLRGDFRAQVNSWRDQLLRLHTEIEASMDFSEDLEDELEDPQESLSQLEEKVINPLRDMLSRYENGKILREGLKLVLVGKPNVGKSSLLNALLGKDRSIVTSIPGTTRDVVEDSFLLSGVLVRILDTAGIRLKPDTIESFGIERTLNSIAEAHLVLWLIDQSRPLTEEDDRVFEAISSSSYLVLLNKADLPSVVSADKVIDRYDLAGVNPIFHISVLNPEDVEKLKAFLSDSFLRKPLDASRSGIIPNLRHKQCFEEALNALLRVRDLLQTKGYPELISMELASARKQLDLVLGLEPDDDLLDRIFSQFCIGK